MNAIQRLAKNTGSLFISQIICYILGFFYIIYIARYLGSEGFGVLSFALAITGIFAVFVDLGLSTMTVREVSKDKKLDNKYLANIIPIKVILSISTFILMALTLKIVGYTQSTTEIVYLMTIYVIFNSFSTTFYSIFQAHEKMEYQAIGNILNSILMFGGVLYLIAHGSNIQTFAILYLATSFIILIYDLVISLWKFHIPQIKIDIDSWKPIIIGAIPLALVSIFTILFIKVDTVMLSKMVGDSAVGLYNAAVTPVQSLSSITGVLMTVALPMFSNFHKYSKNSFEILFYRTFKYLVIITLPVGIGTTILANKFILLIYGPSYSDSTIALQILIWWFVIGSLSWLMGIILNSTNKQKLFANSTGICLVFNICLNVVIIPKLSYIGASISTIVTEILLLILLVNYFPKDIYRPTLTPLITKPLVAGIAMGISIYFLRDYNLLAVLLFSSLLYFLILVLLGGLTRDDLNLLRALKIREELKKY